MLAKAIDQASAGDDLDDADGFRDRLTPHVATIEADQGLTQLTRSSLRQRVVRLCATGCRLPTCSRGIRDQVDPDRAAVHRRRDAAVGYH